MEQISFFLEKFKFLGRNTEIVRGAFIKVVQSVVHVTLLPKSVSFRNETFYIQGTPALKNELFMKRERILSELAQELQSTGKRQIR